MEPKRRSEPLRPFEDEGAVLKRFVERKLLQLARRLDPVEVDMPDGDGKVVRGDDDRKGGARDFARMAEAGEDSAGERRLAGAEIAEQGDDVARSDKCAKAAAESFRFLGGAEANHCC